MKVLIFLSFLTLSSQLLTVEADANGGSTCAGCSILVGLAMHLSQVHATDIVTAVENYVCAKLESPLDEACRRLLDEFGPILIDGIYHNRTPDMLCHDIGLCKQDPGKDFCHLFPLPEKDITFTPYQRRSSSLLSSHRTIRHILEKGIEDYPICTVPGIKEICEKIEEFADDHHPLQDADKDKFSTYPTFRGTHWRGKDCDDTRRDVYAGRKPINNDIEFDSNCNGIYGVDKQSNKPYEELYCSEAPHKGVAILGDSAGAHFHIPAQYFMAGQYNDDTFKDILMVLSDEFDWPQLSSVTAYSENQWPHSIDGPINSIYLQMRQMNHCNHRDYQNIAVNGARSGNMGTTMYGLARNQTLDYPMIVVLALVGNDVCNGHVDTVAQMTTPEEYRKNMEVILNHLNSTLPPGSTVIISGLADGRILWDTLNDKIHPLGALNSDIRYEDLYDYLSCLEISPCTGWMSSNATLRDLTSQRAAELSDVGKNITVTKTYKSFNMIFSEFDVKRMMKEWEAQGGQDWEVIEPVDGFHPSQVGQALSAQFIHELLMTNHTQVLGKKNPYNQKIKEVFGDQGGY